MGRNKKLSGHTREVAGANEPSGQPVEQRELQWGEDIVLYVRSSSDEQTRSCAQQIRVAKDEAKKRGVRLPSGNVPLAHCPEQGVFADEGVSGWQYAPNEREGCRALLRFCEDNRRPDDRPGFIWVWALSRFGRFENGPEECIYWIYHFRQLGWWIVSLTQPGLDSDGEDRLMRIIRTALEAEKDTASSEEKSKGVSRGKQDLIKMGAWHGGAAPVGYERWAARVDEAQRKVIEWVEELPGNKRNPYPDFHTVLRPGRLAEEVRDLFRAYVDGIDECPMSQNALASLWNDESVPIRKRRNKSGQEVQAEVWYQTTIGKVLKNENYIAVQRDRDGNPHRALWEPLIERDLWDRVQARLATNHQRGKGANSIYLLSGLLYCATCGAVMHGDKTDGVHYYKAKLARPGKPPCGACNRRIRVDVIEPAVLEVVPQLADHPICRRRIEEEREALRGGAVRTQRRARELEDRIRDCNEQIERLVGALAIGEAVAKVVQSKMAKLNAEIERLERERVRLRAGETGRSPAAERAAEASVFEKAFANASSSERKDLLAHLLARIDVDIPRETVRIGFRRPPLVAA